MATNIEFVLKAVVQGMNSITQLQGALSGLGSAQTVVTTATQQAIAGATTQTSSNQKQTASTNVLKDTIKNLQNEVAGVRNEYIATGGSTSVFVTKNQELKNIALQAAQSLDKQSTEFRQLTLVAATAERGITTATGGISRLGLASQVSAGIMKSGISSQIAGLIPGGAQAEQVLSSLTTGGISPMGIAAGVAAVALTGVAVGIAKSIGVAADFEQQMYGAQAVLSATSGELSKLSDLAIKMGKDTSFSAKEAASGIEQLGSAGLTAKQVLDGGLAGTLALAAATGVKDLGFAAKTAASTMNAFNLTADQMGHVADVVANAANASALDVNGFADAIASGAAKAHLAKFSLEEFTAAVSIMADHGIRGAEAGTSLGSAMLHATTVSAKWKKHMDDVGFSMSDNNGKMKSLAAVVENLTAVTKDMTEAEKIDFEKKTFGAYGIQAMGTLTADLTKKLASGKTETISGTQVLEERIKTMSKSNAATDAAAIRLQGLKGAQEQMRGSLETLNIVVGQIFLPIATKFVKWTTDALNGVLTFVDGLKKGNIATGEFGAVMKAVWGVVVAIFETRVMPVVRALTPLFVGVFNGMKAAVLGFVNVATQLLTAFEQVLRGDFWGAVKSVVGAVGGAFHGLWQTVKTVFGGMVGTVVQAGKELVNGFVNGIRNTIGSAVKAVTDLGGAAIGALRNVLGIHSPSRVAFEAGTQFTTGFVLGMIERTEGMFTSVNDAWGKLAKIGVSMTGEMLDFLTAKFAATAEAAKASVDKITAAMLEFSSAATARRLQDITENLTLMSDEELAAALSGARLARDTTLVNSILDEYKTRANAAADAAKKLAEANQALADRQVNFASLPIGKIPTSQPGTQYDPGQLESVVASSKRVAEANVKVADAAQKAREALEDQRTALEGVERQSKLNLAADTHLNESYLKGREAIQDQTTALGKVEQIATSNAAKVATRAIEQKNHWEDQTTSLERVEQEHNRLTASLVGSETPYEKYRRALEDQTTALEEVEIAAKRVLAANAHLNESYLKGREAIQDQTTALERIEQAAKIVAAQNAKDTAEHKQYMEDRTTRLEQLERAWKNTNAEIAQNAPALQIAAEAAKAAEDALISATEAAKALAVALQKQGDGGDLTLAAVQRTEGVFTSYEDGLHKLIAAGALSSETLAALERRFGNLAQRTIEAAVAANKLNEVFLNQTTFEDLVSQAADLADEIALTGDKNGELARALLDLNTIAMNTFGTAIDLVTLLTEGEDKAAAGMNRITENTHEAASAFDGLGGAIDRIPNKILTVTHDLGSMSKISGDAWGKVLEGTTTATNTMLGQIDLVAKSAISMFDAIGKGGAAGTKQALSAVSGLLNLIPGVGSALSVVAGTVGNFMFDLGQSIDDWLNPWKKKLRETLEFASTLKGQLENALDSSLGNGIKNFFDGKGDLLSSLRTGLRDAVIGGITDAVIKGAIIKGALGGMLEGLSSAIANGTDPSEWINKIGAALPGLASAMEATLKPLATAVNSAFGYTAPTSSTGTTTGSTTNTGSSGNGITVNGAGGVSIAVDATALAFANVFNTASQRFDLSTIRFDSSSLRFDSSTLRFDSSVYRMETFLDRMFVQNGISRSSRRYA